MTLSFWRSRSLRNVILSNNYVIICSWFPEFFGVVLRILPLHGLFIKRQTSDTSSDNEWYNEWLWMTTNDDEWHNEWQRVIQRETTIDNKWQRVTTNDNEWQQMTTNDNGVLANFFFFSRIREEPTTMHLKETL